MDGSTILAATYIGGSGGDSISAVAVDRSGNIYIAGGTSSTDFPVTADAYQKTPGSSFLSVLSANDRQLLHSTYLAFDSITAIAVDAEGRVLVAGSATHAAFPESIPPTSDATATHPFVAAFSSQLSALSYGRAIDASATGVVNPITVLAMTLDSQGNIFVTGSTNGSPSIFVTKLNSSGTKVWSFAFGGSQSDQPYSLSVDSAGQIHVVGVTVSRDFPVTPGAFRAPLNDALAPIAPGFAAKLSVDGSHLIYSALLPEIGGPLATAIDGEGNLMIAAEFDSGFANFPPTFDAMQPCLNAAESQFGAGVFLELSSDESRELYATVLPPSQITSGMSGWLVGLEPNGLLLVGSDTKQFDVIDTNARPSQGVTCVANAASYRGGAIAAGEIVSLFGPSIGPKEPTNRQPGDVQVRFNGIPAPLLYVSENQIFAVVPFEIAGVNQASVEVNNNGVKLPPFDVSVAAAAPGIFTLDSSGAGQAAVINQDGSVNSNDHPAPPGSIVTVYLTGAGQMQPSVADGSFGTGKTKPVLPISGSLDLQPLVTTYVGDAPTLVQGVVQVNCVVPVTLLESGTAHQLSISFGSPDPNVAIQPGVYVSVK